ncbi:FAD-dependent oxidoreductase [Cellulomonas sp. JZ18]|uniref:FAD-dependent oxidoreductase n=1 Tax=Cellulomonas sp. JZ18 TaxID=2654191 RepID=UPI00351AF36D
MLRYDQLVLTAGAVTRRVPVPGVAEHAIGMKHVEEAVAIRDRLLTAFDRAAALPHGPERARLLTVVFVGGGFSGVEGFAELHRLALDLLDRYPEIDREEVAFHLVELSGRVLVELSTGERIPSGLLVRTAGNAANRVVATHTDLPVDAEYRRLVVRGWPAWAMHRRAPRAGDPDVERTARVLAVAHGGCSSRVRGSRGRRVRLLTGRTRAAIVHAQ